MSGGPPPPPPWWSALQDDFGRFLRAPLIVADGQFRSGPPDPALLARVVDDAAGAGPGARARLALYHEQYWMRLFHTLQQAFPRTARVTGFFAFNRLASAHLQACPPRGRDLADVGRDFYPALHAALEGLLPPGARGRAQNGVVDEHLPWLTPASGDASVAALQVLLRGVDVPWSMLAQALALDEACRRAFEARVAPRFTLTDEALAELRASHVAVRTAPSFSLVRLDWAVDGVDDDAPVTRAPAGNALANAAGAADDEPAGARAGPPSMTRLAVPRHHVLVARDDGVAHAVVDAVFARVLARMRHERFADLVRHVEQKFPPAAVAHLNASFDRFASIAAREGWWIGLRST